MKILIVEDEKLHLEDKLPLRACQKRGQKRRAEPCAAPLGRDGKMLQK